MGRARATIPSPTASARIQAGPDSTLMAALALAAKSGMRLLLPSDGDVPFGWMATAVAPIEVPRATELAT